MDGRIVAIGGGALLDPTAWLEDLLLELAGVPRPRVCFVPTARAQEQGPFLERFYEAFRARACEPTHLELFGVPEEPAARVAAADVVYVAGGNTANLLALWRVHGIDGALRDVWGRGGVLAGWSAGANCWFEDSVTDSFGERLRALGGGLGFLPGSFCPHYDAEPQRRVVLRELLAGGFPAGHAADDDAALVFAGTELVDVVAQRPGARGWRVSAAGEEPLEARLL